MRANKKMFFPVILAKAISMAGPPPPNVVAISGKGLESIGKVGVARCRLERPTGKKGRWVYKAKVWPKVPPGGFTLIEILGVMAIIATLTAGPGIVSETSHVDELLMKTTYL
jgi:prepilin-type N-terminal cleavage/methylation domain-containing protein